MTAGIALIPEKTGAHRAPLRLLDPVFPHPAKVRGPCESIGI